MQGQHLALYRKYRPQTFDDVVGQTHAVSLLTGAIKQKKVAHAYLFCGGRGTGKTTVARIFARDIGCNDEDIIELDAASNRGIDEVRELREAVRTAPFSSPYKVYIIDEAHMLTKEAANALLKTLEEPPAHVVFILATTDPEKLPTTIVSRCQKVEFKQPNIQTLASRLIHVVKSEGKAITESSAELIARHGKGSYRDALGVLEQILAISGSSMKHEDVVLHLGVPQQELMLDLLEALCKKESASVLRVTKELKNSQANALNTYDELIEYIRKGLLLRIGVEKSDDTKLAELASAYPYTIASKSILELLEKRHLLEVSDAHAWTALEAILLSMLESN